VTCCINKIYHNKKNKDESLYYSFASIGGLNMMTMNDDMAVNLIDLLIQIVEDGSGGVVALLTNCPSHTCSPY
jgi:hypothetical protein